MSNLHQARVEAACKAYQAAQNADPYDFKGRMSAALAAADAVVTVDGLQERIEDTLAYYQCRETNPKADHPSMGYHAFSEEQREWLRAKKSDAAAEIVRMILALLRGGEGRCRDCSRPAPARDMLCRNCLAKSEVGG